MAAVHFFQTKRTQQVACLPLNVVCIVLCSEVYTTTHTHAHTHKKKKKKIARPGTIV